MASHVVFTSHELLRLVCAHQCGMPQDMFEFRAFLWSNRPVCPSTADKFVSHWLDGHVLPRVALLVQHVPFARKFIAEFAARHGRVDILEVLTNVFGVSKLRWWDLDEEAASCGHVATLKYLWSIDYIQDVPKCALQAAVGGHVPVLRFLQTTYAFEKWFRTSTMEAAAAKKQLKALQLLYAVWSPTEECVTKRGHMLRTLLSTMLATREPPAPRSMLEWFVGEIRHHHSSKLLVEAFLATDMLPTFVPYLDDTNHVSLLDLLSWTSFLDGDVLVQLQKLFLALPWLREPNPSQMDTKRRYLAEAMELMNLPVMQWLPADMPADDVVALVREQSHFLALAMHLCNVDVVCFYEAHGGAISDALLHRAVVAESSKLKLVKWLVHDAAHVTKSLDGWFSWLVDRCGGRVAVMGRMLKHEAQSNAWIDIFSMLYEPWLAAMKDDEAEKDRIMKSWVTIADTWSRNKVADAVVASNAMKRKPDHRDVHLYRQGYHRWWYTKVEQKGLKTKARNEGRKIKQIVAKKERGHDRTSQGAKIPLVGVAEKTTPRDEVHKQLDQSVTLLVNMKLTDDTNE
ncbi:Aste57867_19873 [Aphanomyces stellatus]|uniref:Aste57867_19873 protein n=1 Tax=Aphanomyces stellatus TaxID=120398 RepID=A0A485LDS3_9STRA|nr:hypothetical protein As57867_019807 [Aphanomyces stellatus]VFT96571.1 Aste57867_19873 [Aphanomyces stellatus]